MIRLFRRIRISLVLVVMFLFDLIVSSISVAQVALGQRQAYPAIIRMPVQVKTRYGIALLAYFTSVTPGSTCLHVAADRGSIFLHILDAQDDETVIRRFHSHYERWILELER